MDEEREKRLKKSFIGGWVDEEINKRMERSIIGDR